MRPRRCAPSPLATSVFSGPTWPAWSARASSPEVLAGILEGAEQAGCDEFILVPAVTDLNFLEVACEVVAARP